MIKIICINNNGEYLLTKDKVYECDDDMWNNCDKFGYISIFDDEGEIYKVYRKTRFIPIAEWREQQIKSVLDE